MEGGRLAHGELEGLVMEVLWDAGEPLVPALVRDRLAEMRPLAYTTVLTILVRLHEKGLVERERAGRANAYWPQRNREEQAALRMGELLTAAKDAPEVLARFVASLSPDQRAELQRAIGDESP